MLRRCRGRVTRARRLLLWCRHGGDGGFLRLSRRALGEALKNISSERRLALLERRNVGRPRARVDALKQKLGDRRPLVVVGQKLSHDLRGLLPRERCL